MTIQVSEQQETIRDSISFLAGQLDQVNREIAILEHKKNQFLNLFTIATAQAQFLDKQAIKVPGENR